MARRSLGSISVPIVLASVTVPMSAALLVGWTLIFAQNLAGGDDVAQNVWLLVLGVIAFVSIMSVLIMFTVFLAREILEVRRQYSFIDSVTHELKSPLASIKLSLQTLGREGLDERKKTLLREMMLSDVDRLSVFIDDILQASRLVHARDMIVNLSAINLRGLVEECALKVCQRQGLEADSFRLNIHPGATLHSDRAAMEVILRNLFDNAVKYSKPEDVHIEVLVPKPENECVEIRVKDRGIGVPEKELKRIFTRFYRVASENVRSRKGTGLGLFVVSALVRNLEGKIHAESDGPERGTTFVVRLPLIDVHAETVES